MKATIWIQEENEQFWVNLENKSGWVNMVIHALKDQIKKEDEMYDNYDPTESITDPFKDLPPEERPIY